MPRRPARFGRRALAGAAALAASAALAGCGGSTDAAAPGAAAAPLPAAGDRGPDLLRGSAPLIDGRPLRLASLRGKVVLVVNTASRCGFTPQFEGLESLYRARRADGLEVVGFPSNDFNQELTGDQAIARFCRLNYGVSFPMARKTHVTGAHANPLFAAIAARPGPAGEPPGWNFTKYLFDRSGRLVARYDSSVEPADPAVTAAIDALVRERPGPV